MAALHFHSATTNVTVSGNTIRGQVGIWDESYSYAPISELNDCIDSPRPFVTGWPLLSGRTYTVAQWSAATGQGSGSSVGSCPG